MNLREQILGVGMRCRFQARVDELNFPEAQLTLHLSRPTTSQLFPAPPSDTCS